MTIDAHASAGVTCGGSKEHWFLNCGTRQNGGESFRDASLVAEESVAILIVPATGHTVHPGLGEEIDRGGVGQRHQCRQPGKIRIGQAR